MHRESIVIVTPAFAEANNGNWQTARRWARFLSPAYRVRLAGHWDAADADPDVGGDADLLIALHARRSADSVAAWRAAHPAHPVLLALTGTDLYRDIHTDPRAQRSLALADAWIVLNDFGARQLPAEYRAKCQVLLQSCSARRTLPRTHRHLRALMVGHLREEKDPQTWFAAARLLAGAATSCSTTSAARSTPRSAPRPLRWPPHSPTTAGWAACRTPACAATSSAPMCWCTPAAWRAARMS